jgi:Protein of unknown function (DUF2490)
MALPLFAVNQSVESQAGGIARYVWLQMVGRRGLFRMVSCLSLFTVFCAGAPGQTSSTVGEFWPLANVYTQLQPKTSLLLYGGKDKGEDFTYDEWKVGGLLNLQLKPILTPHLPDIDINKEQHLVLGAGYQYSETIQSGSPSHENRMIAQVTPQHRPAKGFFLADRNRVEFRWVNGKYSTRYRNLLTVERSFQAQGVRVVPYASGELFYDSQTHSWNENRYAFGMQLPYKRIFMLDNYYQRQNCTCSPNHENIWGLTLNFFFRNTR